MLKSLLILLLVASPAFAQNIRTVETIKIETAHDLEECFRLPAYELSEKHGDAQARQFIDSDQIKQRCLTKVEALASRQKSVETLKAFAEEIRKAISAESSLVMFQFAARADQSKKVCQDTQLFEAVKAGLSHPMNYPSAKLSYAQTAKQIVEVCLSNSQFKEDIVEEAGHDNEYLKKNLCPVLKTKKLDKNCK